MFKDSFSTEEWRTLQFAPLWVFGAVALIDTKTDEKEIAALAKELSEAPLFKELLVREVFGSTAADFAHVWDLYVADSRDVLRGLTDVADLLDRKVTPEQAKAFRSALMLIGSNVAKASGGGVFHRETISDKEKAALVASGLALRF